MTLSSALSWLEIACGLSLMVFGAWLFLELPAASPGVDEHGYLAMGAFAVLCLAFTLSLAGGSLRLSSRWRWAGHIPLLGLLVAIYVCN